MHHGLLPWSIAGDGACARTQILDLSTCKMSGSVEEAWHYGLQQGAHNHLCQDVYQITSLARIPTPCTAKEGQDIWN